MEEPEGKPDKLHYSFNLACLIAAVAFGVWPLIAYRNVVYLGAVDPGKLKFALDLNFVVLVPALCFLSILVSLCLLKSRTYFRKFASATFHVLIGCMIAYSFLYLFASNINWRENHIRVRNPFVQFKE